MEKHYCDVCSKELTSETGQEFVGIIVGGHRFQKETCAEHAFTVKRFWQNLFGDPSFLGEWSIQREGRRYG